MFRLFQIFLLSVLLAAVSILLYKVEGLETRIYEIRPASYIQTEFVVIKTCEEDFDVAEMGR